MNISFQSPRDELISLRAKRRRDRSPLENDKVTNLPVRLRILQDEINELVRELGSNDYRDMPGGSSEYSYHSRAEYFINIKHCIADKGGQLIRIRVAKSTLYGAKVDLFEMQKLSDRREGV